MNKNTITQSEFKARREKLMQQMSENSIAILTAAPEYERNHDASFAYRQNSSFQYLTGFNEPEAAAVFIPGRKVDGKNAEFIFFNQMNNIDLEIWIGKRIGQEGACKEYGADEAYPIEKLDEMMPKLMEGKDTLYFTFGACAELDKKVANWLGQIRRTVRSGTGAPENLIDINKIIFELRLIKSDAEIALMRHAAETSAQAHILGMEACRDAKHEYQVEAVMWNHLAMNGFRAWAYTPIVGGGANACVLHYIENDDALKDGELLLVDAGGEWECYSSDITRTYPVNGKYTPEQKSIYELVLKSQKAGIEALKPGIPWNTVQLIIVRILTEGLVELGILKGSVDALIKTEAYKQYYMHNSGHWLGLDTHDVGKYKINGQWRDLKAGMVITVEPGLYIKAGSDADPKWWNIGVRIEDDVVVTETGYDVLSKSLPKEVSDIEALMQK